MRYVTSILIAVAGVIHLLPLTGALGRARLVALYGLDFSDPNLAIMMRHRAVLFGLLGGFLLWAALRPSLHWPAIAVGLISAGSFLWFAWSTGEYNAAIARIVQADVVAVAALVAAALLKFFAERK